MIDRQIILSESIDKCLADMYKWAQPSIDITKLIASDFKDNKQDPIYKKHYLSQNNYKYIVDAYIRAYGMKDEWKNNFKVLIDYLDKGGLKDKYIEATKNKPGYRSYEKVPSIYAYLDKEDADIVLSLIAECRDFYRHNLEENKFSMTMALGVGSPTCNAKSVESYWHEHGFPDFTIEEYNIENIISGFDDESLNISEEDFIIKLQAKTPHIYGL